MATIAKRKRFQSAVKLNDEFKRATEDGSLLELLEIDSTRQMLKLVDQSYASY